MLGVLTSNAFKPPNPLVLSNSTTYNYDANISLTLADCRQTVNISSKPSILLKHDVRHRFYLAPLKCPEQKVRTLFVIALLQGLHKLQCHVA